jgi:hypothetical protein
MKLRALHDLGVGDKAYFTGQIFEADVEEAKALIDQELAEPVDREEEPGE